MSRTESPFTEGPDKSGTEGGGGRFARKMRPAGETTEGERQPHTPFIPFRGRRISTSRSILELGQLRYSSSFLDGIKEVDDIKARIAERMISLHERISALQKG